MKGMKDILVLGGVIAAGYLLLQSGDSGGGSIQYIRNIPRSFSPEVKEAPPAPTVIQLPSETVTFPSPKLPTVTSLIPTIPKTQSVSKTPQITSTPKKEAKVTTTPTTESFTYGEPTKKKYTEPSPESWEAFTTEVWGSKPGEINKKWGVGTVASFEDVSQYGYPQSYLNWLGLNQIPTKKEISEQKKKLEGTPLAEYFERVGHGGKVTIPAKKEQKAKESPYWQQALNEPERFSERRVWEIAKNIESKKTTTKKTVEKKPPALPGVTWVKKGTGWIAA